MTEIPMATPKPQRSGTQPQSAGDSAHTPAQRQGSGRPQNRRKNTRRRAAQKGNATAQASQIQPKRYRRRKGNAQRSVNHSYAASSHLPVSDETSAGGLVLSGISEALKPNNKVDLGKIYAALIGRLDRRGRLLWSMPKGHIEPNESYATTAEREVWEETGITGKVFAPLGTIDYWFVSDGMRIHKNVHHHLLAYVDGILNDEDPEVTEVAWIPVNHLLEYLSYADERKLARKAINQLPGLVREHAGEATPR